MQTERKVVLSIQYLRVAAAILVVMSHVVGHASLTLYTTQAGVDIFFVISGFIMWAVTFRRAINPARFMLDRVIRIAPTYVLLTLAIAWIAAYIPGVFPNMRTNVSHIVLSVLFVPHADPYGTFYPVVVPGWTLTYEMFFYAIFALNLLLPTRCRKWSLTVIMGFLVAIGFMYRSEIEAIRVYTNPLMLEFVAGIWLGVAWQSCWFPGVIWGWIAAIAGMLMLVIWQVQIGSLPTTFRALDWGLPATLIVGGFLIIEQQTNIMHSRVLLLLADASFSIYLIHVFLVAAAWKVFAHFPLPVYLIGATGASVIGGVVFWWTFERSLTIQVRRWSRRPPYATAVAL